MIAAAGGAIGLGNIWKFPYLAGMHGGGAFVLVYLVTICMVGLPLMAAEIMLGKHTQLSPVLAFKSLKGPGTPWKYVGVLSIVTAFLILSYYSVVAGWTLHYLYLSLRGAFANQDPEGIYGMFAHLYASPGLNVSWHLVVMLATTWIVWRGVKGGLELGNKIMMPLLVVLLLILMVNSLCLEGAEQGLKFLFKPDFSKLTPATIIAAVGQGFFSLSLGMGCMMTYGSYLPRSTEIAKPSLAVVISDTSIALLAGAVIFPIVFSYGFEPAAGTGLVFRTLPVIFAKMPAGQLLAVFFFLVLFLAALTSAISLLEVPVACALDCKALGRRTGSVIMGAAIFVLGILPALSGGVLSGVKIPLFNRNIFDTMDYLASNLFLPIGGILICVFVGWCLPTEMKDSEFRIKAPIWWSYRVWLFFMRFVAPVGVLAVLLSGLGVFSG